MKWLKLPFYDLLLMQRCLATLLLIPSSFLFAQTINKAEYFFDTDPGKGNGIPLVIPLPADPLTISFTIPTTGLAPGRHYFYIRTRTSNGNWSLYEPREFFIQAPISTAEYFFDTDPGVTNGTPISTTVIDDFTFTTSIDLTGVSPGRHLLYIREKDESGSWSLSEPREFFIQTPITKAEFFFDTDPGIDNATPVSINTVDDFNFTSVIPVGMLSNGDHYLFLRVKDETGTWSLHEPKLFTVDSALPVTLLNFSGERLGKHVVLSWTTASETNNDYFDIERWIPGDTPGDKNFMKIGTLRGHGTTTSPHHYQFSDHDAFTQQTIYYRLKQVDYNGISTYSQVVAVLPASGNMLVKLYPNPGSTFFTLEVSDNEDDTVAVEILTMAGIQMSSYEKVSRSITFGSDWPAGVYLVRIIKPNEVVLVKVVKAP